MTRTPKNYKEEYTKLNKRYWERIHSATPEERFQAQVDEESVADKILDEMQDIDYTFWYNDGVFPKDIESVAVFADGAPRVTQEQYEQFISDWGLKEQDGTKKSINLDTLVSDEE